MCVGVRVWECGSDCVGVGVGAKVGESVGVCGNECVECGSDSV